jgi:hypothetical protein
LGQVFVERWHDGIIITSDKLGDKGFIYLTPFIPLSLGGWEKERGRI